MNRARLRLRLLYLRRAVTVGAVVCVGPNKGRDSAPGLFPARMPTDLPLRMVFNAGYAVAQIKDGRRVGSSLNVREVLSPYAQRNKGFHVERLDHYDDEDQAWNEVLVEDRHAGPANTARVRLDFASWLDSLKRRDRRIAEFLANGESTKAAARKFKVSAGRISQLRRELAQSWRTFVGDEPGGAALAA